MALAAVALSACEQRAERCGPGTIEMDGVCLVAGSPEAVCGTGTRLDPAAGVCVPDLAPIECTGGTACTNGDGVDYCTCSQECEAP